MQSYNPGSARRPGLGCSLFARHYLGNHCCFLFHPVLRCFSSRGWLSDLHRSNTPSVCWVVPFGNLRIKAYLTTPRSLSQSITSFIACNRQGIHHMHLFTWSYNEHHYCCRYKLYYMLTCLCRIPKLLIHTNFEMFWFNLMLPMFVNLSKN